MRVIWTKRFLKGTNSWHLRFTTGRVWIYCRRRCSRYHYIASLHLFGPNTEQTQQGYRDESQEFRRTSMFGRSRHLQWTCFWFNRIIYASLLFLFFLGDCACVYHIDTYTDTYIRALHIDLQWLMICNVYNYNINIYIHNHTHTHTHIYIYVCMYVCIYIYTHTSTHPPQRVCVGPITCAQMFYSFAFEGRRLQWQSGSQTGEGFLPANARGTSTIMSCEFHRSFGGFLDFP